MTTVLSRHISENFVSSVCGGSGLITAYQIEFDACLHRSLDMVFGG